MFVFLGCAFVYVHVKHTYLNMSHNTVKGRAGRGEMHKGAVFTHGSKEFTSDVCRRMFYKAVCIVNNHGELHRFRCAFHCISVQFCIGLDSYAWEPVTRQTGTQS